MNLVELMNQIQNLGGEIRAAAATLAGKASDNSVPMSEIEAMQQNLGNMNKRLAALQATYDTMLQQQQGGLQPMGQEPKAQPKGLKDMLASNEYARAFAYAISHGINRKNGRGNEQVKILYDALTEGGGSPVGSDGGFLVPEDIDQQIIEQRRALDPLAAYFGEEIVTAPTGWRVRDTAPNRGLVDVGEMGSIDDDDDQPLFVKIPYTTSKKALILPVSNELAVDNVANLFAYLSRWFAKKLVITENNMIVTALRNLTATALDATDPLAGLKKALNVALDPAISATAKIIVNQSGFDALDAVNDEMGRPLLQPNPTDETMYRIKGRQVHVVSNGIMGNVTSNSSSASVLYIGDGMQYATLFRVGGFELASTDIGGNAWRTDSTELRGIARLGLSVYDTGAMVARSIAVTA